ncbi:MAG: hypothetical protein ACTSYM_13480 [Candidatus Baldrarchaeia archaeon]
MKNHDEEEHEKNKNKQLTFKDYIAFVIALLEINLFPFVLFITALIIVALMLNALFHFLPF